MPAKASRVPKLRSKPSLDAASIREMLEQFQPVQSIVLRWAIAIAPWPLLVHSLFYLRSDPMFSTGEWTVAAALLLFGFLMSVIPDTFRTLWDRNMIACRPARPEQATEGQALPETGSQNPAEAEFRRFIVDFNSLLNGRGQIITGLILGLFAGAWVPLGRAFVELGAGKSGPDVLADEIRYLQASLGGYLLSMRFLLYFVLGILIGLLVWRMVATSYAIWKLGNRFDLLPQLGHPDRCGGFAPLGYLCLWSALISSVAAIYLGGWIIILGSNLGTAGSTLDRRYRTDLYVPLFSAYLAVPVVYAILSFILPVWNVHRIMAAKREAILQKLDVLGNRIDRLSREMLEQAESRSPAENEDAAKRLDLMRKTYENNKAIPVWPFNTDIMVRFVSSLTVPLLGLTHLGQPIVNTIAEFVKFLGRQAP